MFKGQNKTLALLLPLGILLSSPWAASKSLSNIFSSLIHACRSKVLGAKTYVSAPTLIEKLVPPEYEFLETLSVNQRHIVYQARHRRSGRVVIIKHAYNPPSDGEALLDQSNLRHEARIYKRLQENQPVPFFPRLFHSQFDAQNRYYLELEAIEGHTLAQHISALEIDSLPSYKKEMTELLRIAQDLTTFLDFLHRKNAVYLDLKPENNMIAASDGQLKIIDLESISFYKKDPSESGQHFKVRAYTPGAYAPPEVLRRHDVTYPDKIGPHSDYYSLGMLLRQYLEKFPQWTVPPSDSPADRNLLRALRSVADKLETELIGPMTAERTAARLANPQAVQRKLKELKAMLENPEQVPIPKGDD